MNAFRPKTAVSTILSLALCIAAHANAQQGPSAQKWEYAKMSVSSIRGNSDVLFSFASLQARVDAKSWKELCQKMGLQPGPQVDYLVLALGAAGKEGWELAYHDRNIDDIGTTETWIFKRLSH